MSPLSPSSRFDIALSKAQAISYRMPHNPTIAALHAKAGALSHARSKGNELFNAGNYTGALAEYGQVCRWDDMWSMTHVEYTDCF